MYYMYQNHSESRTRRKTYMEILSDPTFSFLCFTRRLWSNSWQTTTKDWAGWKRLDRAMPRNSSFDWGDWGGFGMTKRSLGRSGGCRQNLSNFLDAGFREGGDETSGGRMWSLRWKSCFAGPTSGFFYHMLLGAISIGLVFCIWTFCRYLG